MSYRDKNHIPNLRQYMVKYQDDNDNVYWLKNIDLLPSPTVIIVWVVELNHLILWCVQNILLLLKISQYNLIQHHYRYSLIVYHRVHIVQLKVCGPGCNKLGWNLAASLSCASFPSCPPHFLSASLLCCPCQTCTLLCKYESRWQQINWINHERLDEPSLNCAKFMDE